MNVTINPSKALGSISAPPSKSLAHRYIICAALSKGVSRISNVDFSEDIKATLDCIMALGAKVEVNEDTVTIEGIDSENLNKDVDFYCRESGSTMRFFMGLAMYFGCNSRFFGSETLRKRPFGIYEEICREQNIIFERQTDHIQIHGQIKGGDISLAGNISSQFITGLLFVYPLLKVDSTISLIPPVESRSYINLTLQALDMFGVKAAWIDETTLSIKGNQSYKPKDVAVEGDYSNAAFLDAFNYIGGKVETEGLNIDSLQGDKVYKEYFEKLNERGAVIDITDCPDLGPILFSLAAAKCGATFTGTRRLKMKESDRGSVMCQELSKFGIDSVIEENTIEIKAGTLHKPKEVLDGHNDHRIVMSMATLLSLTGGEISGAEAVRKSYPGYFEDIIKLGIEVTKDGMDK